MVRGIVALSKDPLDNVKLTSEEKSDIGFSILRTFLSQIVEYITTSQQIKQRKCPLYPARVSSRVIAELVQRLPLDG